MTAPNIYLRAWYARYGFSDAESFRDALLSSFSGAPLLSQFQERKIVLFRRTRISHFALLDVYDDGFHILLNRERSVRQWLVDIGHELIHTFHYDLSTLPPVNLFRKMFGDPDPALEYFCDSVARRWLLQDRNARALVALLRSQRWQGEVLWIPKPLHMGGFPFLCIYCKGLTDCFALTIIMVALYNSEVSFINEIPRLRSDCKRKSLVLLGDLLSQPLAKLAGESNIWQENLNAPNLT